MKDKPVTVTLFVCSSIYCLNYNFKSNISPFGHLSITINLKAFLVYPFDRIYDLLVCLPHTSLINLPGPNTGGLYGVDQEAAEATTLHDMQGMDGGAPW